MHQTKLGSLIESSTNVIIGYFIGVLTQMLLFPYFGLHVTIGQNMLLCFLFTTVSLIRNYIIRRWFNNRLHLFSEKINMMVHEVK